MEIFPVPIILAQYTLTHIVGQIEITIGFLGGIHLRVELRVI